MAWQLVSNCSLGTPRRRGQTFLSFLLCAYTHAPKYPMQPVPKANKHTDQLQNTNTQATANCKTQISPVALLSNPLRTSPNRRVAASGGEGMVATVGCCSPGGAAAGPMAGAGGAGWAPPPPWGGSAILVLACLATRKNEARPARKTDLGCPPLNDPLIPTCLAWILYQKNGFCFME